MTTDTKTDTKTNNGMDALRTLYALTDAERFPASQLAEGLERASSLYWADFSVADAFGVDAVKDTFANAHYKTIGHKMLTELALVCNHKAWQHFDLAKIGSDEEKMDLHFELGTLYRDYWEIVDDYAKETLKGDELDFYSRVID